MIAAMHAMVVISLMAALVVMALPGERWLVLGIVVLAFALGGPAVAAARPFRCLCGRGWNLCNWCVPLPRPFGSAFGDCRLPIAGLVLNGGLALHCMSHYMRPYSMGD